ERGGPRDGPPHPPTLGAPRRSHGAPLSTVPLPRLNVGGPEMAPHTPQRSERPGKSSGALLYIPLLYRTLAIAVRTRSARSWAAARESVVGFTASAGW